MNNTDNGTTSDIEVIEGIICAVLKARRLVDDATCDSDAHKIGQYTWERLLSVYEHLHEAYAALQDAQFAASRW